MKIIDRYIVSKLLLILLFSFLTFIVISIVVDVIEHVDDYIDSKAKFFDVVLYYIYYLPFIIVLIAPVTTLLGATITCILFSRHREIIAMRASGLSTLRIAFPILTIAFILSIFFLLFAELVVPNASAKKNEILVERVDKDEKRKQDINKVLNNVVFKGENKEVYYINRYFVKKSHGFGVLIQYYDDNGKLRERIDAKELSWKDGKWNLEEGYKRTFEDDSESASQFTEMTVSIKAKPEDFAKQQQDPEQMGFFELYKHIKKVESWGGNPQKEKVDLLIKISFPFANFIILLFGVPFTLRYRRKGTAIGLAQSLMIAFIYYGVIRAGQAFGYNGAISPFSAAFLGNIIFLVAGVSLLLWSNQ
ncbi:MAG: LPS export ABC transporter permease LptG [Acidobacteria bacterium]|nr:LPS export ABC transporter permease LptG [Acidobacteriota bacterium]